MLKIIYLERMKLKIIDNTISSCQEHIIKSGISGTEIESFLTRYLLVMICASFEDKIKEMIINRVNKVNDLNILNYFNSTYKNMNGRIRIEQLKETLKKFGDDYKDSFNKKTNSDSIKAQFYDNIINNRHDTAHGSGSNISFNELILYYESGHEILDFFNDSIGN